MFGVRWDVGRHKNDEPRAEVYLRSATDANPNDPMAHHALGKFLKCIREDHAAAEQCFKQALNLDPRCAPALHSYAQLAWHINHDYLGAQRMFEQGLQQEPSNVTLILSYAQFLQQVKKNSEANPRRRLFSRRVEWLRRLLAVEWSGLEGNEVSAGTGYSQKTNAS